MGKRRLVIATVVLLLLAGILTVVWRVCDWPPPRLILKYGLPPAGGPTGRVREFRGNRFVELSPGYRHLRRHLYRIRGSAFADVLAFFGLRTGNESRRHPLYEDRWIEVERTIWVSTRPLHNISWSQVGEYFETWPVTPGKLRKIKIDELWYGVLAGGIRPSPYLLAWDLVGPPDSDNWRHLLRESLPLGHEWECFTGDMSQKNYDQHSSDTYIHDILWDRYPLIWIPPEDAE